MTTKHLMLRLMASIALFFAYLSTSQANSISLSPAIPNVSTGSNVSLNLIYNFTDTSQGGGLDIWFGDYSNPGSPKNTFSNGSGLTFVSYTPNAAFGQGDAGFVGNDPISSNSAQVKSDHLDQLNFGSLYGLPSGIGDVIVGTLVFAASQAGNYYLTLADNLNAGGFVDTNGRPLNYTYTGAVIQVTGNPVNPPPPAAVPLPPAVYLVGSGLVAVFARARRRSTNTASNQTL